MLLTPLAEVCVLICFIDPRVRKIRNEASSCPGIFARTLRGYSLINTLKFKKKLTYHFVADQFA